MVPRRGLTPFLLVPVRQTVRREQSPTDGFANTLSPVARLSRSFQPTHFDPERGTRHSRCRRKIRSRVGREEIVGQCSSCPPRARCQANGRQELRFATCSLQSCCNRTTGARFARSLAARGQRGSDHRPHLCAGIVGAWLGAPDLAAAAAGDRRGLRIHRRSVLAGAPSSKPRQRPLW